MKVSKTAATAATPLAKRGPSSMTSAMTEPLDVSFLGLGVMGGAIARHIGAAGHRLTVYNRSEARLARWQEANPELPARIASSPATNATAPLMRNVAGA